VSEILSNDEMNQQDETGEVSENLSKKSEKKFVNMRARQNELDEEEDEEEDEEDDEEDEEDDEDDDGEEDDDEEEEDDN